jgi:hypothetical protein
VNAGFSRGIILALFLAACATLNARTGTPAPLDVVTALERGWFDAGLPSLKDCDHLREATVYEATSALDFTRRCLGASSSHAASCLMADVTLGGVARPLVVLRPGQAPYDSAGGPVLHELLHWCSGEALGDVDGQHRNPQVWAKDHSGASAQARAARLLPWPRDGP